MAPDREQLLTDMSPVIRSTEAYIINCFGSFRYQIMRKSNKVEQPSIRD